ncbi:hypothetical protein TESG_04382 [Trichophyton tonsurans CBS 112818]|uniref:Uncharacterized protein n=1 Tax=Trichophyton tonsurans (strain CBS 112818) TaxID=647933 RepID=F2S059_TRIT1|nr:hypothetical protein TESG_04382 [Trichophyton tonsurans CBS 112818]
MPGDNGLAMSRTASSTSIQAADLSGPPPPTPALVPPAKAKSVSPAPDAAPKPLPTEGAGAGEVEDGLGAEKLIMHPTSVYIVISEPKHPSEKFHWGIIVARGQQEGILYHRIFDGSRWELKIEENKDISADKAVIILLKVGNVPDVSRQWIEAIHGCITTANVPWATMGDVSCRTFALAATYELGNGGFINIYPNWNKVKGIERESYQFAWHAGNLGRRLVVASQWSDL